MALSEAKRLLSFIKGELTYEQKEKGIESQRMKNFITIIGISLQNMYHNENVSRGDSIWMSKLNIRN